MHESDDAKMNEVAVRTHRGEYYAGETVYGMIYLRVAIPGFTGKIQLQISGIEHCEYFPIDGDDWSINHRTDCLRNPYTDKVMANPVEIFSPKEPLPVGSYKFPFHYKLKPDLPSSTSISLSSGNWEGSVIYKVTATVSDSISDSQFFVCLGKNIVDLVKVAYHEETTIKMCYCYERGRISLMAELDRPFYTTGDTIKLVVTVKNSSSELAKSVQCWLMRTVRMFGFWMGKEQSKADAQTSLMYTTHRGNGRVRLQDEVSIDAENIDHVRLGSVGPKQDLKWTCDIPLSRLDSPLPSSTKGSYLKIVYSILVHVAVPRATDLTVTIPDVQVLPSQNNENRPSMKAYYEDSLRQKLIAAAAGDIVKVWESSTFQAGSELVALAVPVAVAMLFLTTVIVRQ